MRISELCVSLQIVTNLHRNEIIGEFPPFYQRLNPSEVFADAMVEKEYDLIQFSLNYCQKKFSHHY